MRMSRLQCTFTVFVLTFMVKVNVSDSTQAVGDYNGNWVFILVGNWICNSHIIVLFAMIEIIFQTDKTHEGLHLSDRFWDFFPVDWVSDHWSNGQFQVLPCYLVLFFFVHRFIWMCVMFRQLQTFCVYIFGRFYTLSATFTSTFLKILFDFVVVAQLIG